jgi:cholestenol delta-isomerase
MEQHPYHPVDLHLPNYVPNDRSVEELLGVFFGFLTLSLLILWVGFSRTPHMKDSLWLKVKVSWFFMCGLIHLILEGYFGIFHGTIAERQSYLAQMWKEYSKGDSRYITDDTFTVCMENITAFVDGPLAFLATLAFMRHSPYRFVVQMVLSLFQLYGDMLYFSTEVREGFIHGPVGHPLYFWFYFVFLNTFWIVVPLACIIESWRHLVLAQMTYDSRLLPNSKKCN